MNARAGIAMRTSLRVLLLAGLWLGLSAFPAAAKGPNLPELAPGSSGKRLPGKFVWAELVTDDLVAAQRFYGALFGWRFQGISPGYAVAALEERPLAGILLRPKPKDAPAQPRWLGFISVPDVARAIASATNAGARLLVPPEKLPRRGEQAIFADPEGAICGLIRSSSGDPGDFLAAPGEWIWIQLLSRTGADAAKFYRRVAGYEIVENVESNRLSDLVLTRGGYARATVRTIPAGNDSVKPTWLPFIRVASVVESVSRARDLGGSVRIEPRPDYLEGRVAVIADPTGAAVGLLEWSDALLMEGRKGS